MSNYNELPERLRVTADLFDYRLFKEQKDDHVFRRLYLRGSILSEESNDPGSINVLSINELVDKIRLFNQEDSDKLEASRTPIKLFIDSRGGDTFAGFKLVDAITTSRTPVYTINESRCYSTAFLIFICGHKRFSAQKATFLMHDGLVILANSTNKAFETADFFKKYEEDVVKNHILQYSTMTGEEYNKIRSKEYYMLPNEAMKHGFLDEIITLKDGNCDILY